MSSWRVFLSRKSIKIPPEKFSISVADMRGAFVLLVALGVASAGPIYPESPPPQQHVSSEVKVALIKVSKINVNHKIISETSWNTNLCNTHFGTTIETHI